MSLVRIRLGVRIAAGVIGVLALATAGCSIQLAAQHRGPVDDAVVFRGLALVVIVAGVWVIVEVVVGGFEQIARTTRERYERLQSEAPDAYAIAGQA